MVNKFLFCMCVCVLQVTWRANGIVLYMYEGKVLMDMRKLYYVFLRVDRSEFSKVYCYCFSRHGSLLSPSVGKLLRMRCCCLGSSASCCVSQLGFLGSRASCLFSQ